MFRIVKSTMKKIIFISFICVTCVVAQLETPGVSKRYLQEKTKKTITDKTKITNRITNKIATPEVVSRRFFKDDSPPSELNYDDESIETRKQLPEILKKKQRKMLKIYEDRSDERKMKNYSYEDDEEENRAGRDDEDENNANDNKDVRVLDVAELISCKQQPDDEDFKEKEEAAQENRRFHQIAKSSRRRNKEAASADRSGTKRDEEMIFEVKENADEDDYVEEKPKKRKEYKRKHSRSDTNPKERQKSSLWRLPSSEIVEVPLKTIPFILKAHAMYDNRDNTRFKARSSKGHSRNDANDENEENKVKWNARENIRKIPEAQKTRYETSRRTIGNSRHDTPELTSNNLSEELYLEEASVSLEYE